MSDPKRETVERFLEYLEKERNYSPLTIQSYRRDLTQFCRFLNTYQGRTVGHFRGVDRFTGRHFLNYLMETEFQLGGGRKGNLNQRSVARKLAAVKSMFKYLVKAEEIAVDPLSSLKAPKLSRKLPSFLEEGIIPALANLPFPETFEIQRDLAIMEFFYSTGMRLAELVSVSVRDLDSEENLVRVVGKGNKERIIPFGDTAKKRISVYLRVRAQELGTPEPEHRLFVTRRGASISPRTVQHRLKQLFDQLSVRLAPVPESTAGCRDRAMVELTYSTPLKPRDLVKLNVSHVKTDNGHVTVTRPGNPDEVYSLRDLPADSIASYLEKRRGPHTGDEPPSETSPLFTSDEGKPMNLADIQRVVRDYRKRGFKFSPHVLRHTFATHLVDRGMDIRAVKELLGHASLSSTQLYTHMRVEQMKKEYDRAHPHA
ncbi:MAG: tyrosine-type recombinase/integrase [Fidelibacterota bacterium]